MTGMYSALDIIRLVFGEDSGYDVTELEDLLEQQQQHASSTGGNRDECQVAT